MLLGRPLSWILLFVGFARALAIPADQAITMLPSSDARFFWEGRFDRTDPGRPVIIWAGSRLGLDFEGGHLAVLFGEATGQNYFNISVDGKMAVVGVPAGPEYRFVWPHTLTPGKHRLELFKRSEADAGHVAIAGVELAAGARAWAPERPSYRLRMEFIGDSITVGACNEDGATDQWDDRRTHNHALSYGWLTAQALGADERAVAVSGMGIAEGYVEMKAGEVWDKTYPRATAARADLQSWQPDVVCLNFGENDDSFTRNQQRPFPADYTAGYVALVRSVRAAYPRASIVLLRGGMFGGAKSPELKAAWDKVMREVEGSDPGVAHFVFTHWSEQHPRVSDHRAMAAELTEWLKAQSFMQTRLR